MMFNQVMLLLSTLIYSLLGLSAILKHHYQGMFYDLFGVNAVIVGMGMVMASVVVFTNSYVVWIKWFKTKDWPLLTCFVIVWELFIRFSVAFLEGFL